MTNQSRQDVLVPPKNWCVNDVDFRQGFVTSVFAAKTCLHAHSKIEFDDQTINTQVTAMVSPVFGPLIKAFADELLVCLPRAQLVVEQSHLTSRFALKTPERVTDFRVSLKPNGDSIPGEKPNSNLFDGEALTLLERRLKDIHQSQLTDFRKKLSSSNNHHWLLRSHITVEIYGLEEYQLPILMTFLDLNESFLANSGLTHLVDALYVCWNTSLKHVHLKLIASASAAEVEAAKTWCEELLEKMTLSYFQRREQERRQETIVPSHIGNLEDASSPKQKDEEKEDSLEIQIPTISDHSIAVLKDLKSGAYKDQAMYFEKLYTLIQKRVDQNSTVARLVKTEKIDLSGFPNFSEVADFIGHYLVARKNTSQPFRIPPVLLEGPPGVGKTEFLTYLCEQLGMSFSVVNMSGISTGAYIGGSEVYWANSRHGIVVEKILRQGICNPMIFLDEIDKAVATGRHADPLGSLHSLLERKSSRSFEDVSMPGVLFDASHISWVASANDRHKLEEPILDRFRVFQISPPSRQHMAIIIPLIYRNLASSEGWSHILDGDPTPDAVDFLSAMTPREARKSLELAIAKTVSKGRSTVAIEDLDGCITRQKLGFLA